MDATELERRAEALRRDARALATLPRARRVRALCDTAAELADAETDAGRALRAALMASSGLSHESIEWGLSTTLATLTPPALEALLEPEARGAPVTLTAVVLAGNVFSAALRPLALPLACGVPVLAKAAIDDDALPRAFATALSVRDAELARALEVTRFGRDERELEAALVAHADSVTVLGSDEAIADIRARLPAGVSLVARGHGLGALHISESAIEDELDAVAARAALDVAAYDQRGCLSPHVALVQGDVAAAERFAATLANALSALEHSLPRGRVPEPALAEQLQWRGVAAARGALHEGGGFAVSYEGHAPLRPSPGYRNLGVYTVADTADARARLAAFGAHLKALGIAATEEEARTLADLAPYTCRVGTMQTPPLGAHLDGLSPLAGYFTR